MNNREINLHTLREIVVRDVIDSGVNGTTGLRVLQVGAIYDRLVIRQVIVGFVTLHWNKLVISSLNKTTTSRLGTTANKFQNKERRS